MPDEYENKSSYQAQSSETLSGDSSGISPDMDYVRPAENAEQDLYPLPRLLATTPSEIK